MYLQEKEEEQDENGVGKLVELFSNQKNAWRHGHSHHRFL